VVQLVVQKTYDLWLSVLMQPALAAGENDKIEFIFSCYWFCINSPVSLRLLHSVSGSGHHKVKKYKGGGGLFVNVPIYQQLERTKKIYDLSVLHIYS
jgi:hypothetical protein